MSFHSHPFLTKAGAVAAAALIACSSAALPASASVTYDYATYQKENQYGENFIYSSDEFDAAYYAEENPDVASAYGIKDPAALTDAQRQSLYQHYSTSGVAEHRKARMDRASLATPTTFNAKRYADENPDLAAAYGNDAAALLQHYKTTGCAEGRKGAFNDELTDTKDMIFSVARQITNDDMSDRAKAEAVIHWLVDHVHYDLDNYYAGTIPETDYNIEGPMLYHKSVCEGYSMTFAYFMKVLNIPCLVISGEDHAWNKVKLGDTWYYTDVTWADGYYTDGTTFFNSRYDLTTDGTFGDEPSHQGGTEYPYHDAGFVRWS